MGIPFSKFTPFCTAFGLEWKFLGRRPKPTLLFFIAKKVSKKASPLGTYKTYFEPGVLQLPTVGQIKRLYNSVQNRFYKQVQKGAFNGNGKQHDKQQTTRGKQHSYIFFHAKFSGGGTKYHPPLEHKNLYFIGTPPTRFISFFCGRIIC